ncbi:MAG: TorF family putative porin, partial [Balneolaceae bacterium]
MKYTSIKELNTIKNLLKGVCATALVMTMMTSLNLKDADAQEVTLTPGVDFYSTYVFRGVAFSGPSIQPYVEFEAGSFTFGGWGSQGYDGFQEMDLYASYSFDFGLSIGLTDYYYPGSEYFDGDSHAFEINTGIEISNFSLAANMVLNEASGAGSAGEDLYFEAGLTVGSADLFVGAGDGWHSSDGEFNLVNVG